MSYKDFLHTALNFSGMMSLAHMIQRRRPKILMFHRICETERYSGIDKCLFEEQIKYLSEKFNVVSMKEMIDNIRSGSKQSDAVSITFDDGHADFYHLAWPILKKYRVTATLYITTGFIDKTCWLWPDALRYILENTRKKRCTDPDGSECGLNLECFKSSWNTLADHALSLSSGDRAKFLRRLSEELNVDVPDSPVQPYLGCSWAQIREMISEGLDVGSHSVSHPILSSLDDAELKEELNGSARKIETELGFFPVGICYPNGTPSDVDERVTNVAEKLGYQYGVVAYPCRLSAERLMKLGRLPAPTNFNLFQRMMNGISRLDIPKEEKS